MATEDPEFAALTPERIAEIVTEGRAKVSDATQAGKARSKATRSKGVRRSGAIAGPDEVRTRRQPPEGTSRSQGRPRKDATQRPVSKRPRILPPDVIRAIMKEHGLNQVKMAKVLGVTPGYLSNILAGRNELSEVYVRRMSKRLKLD
jgi:DNA-binding transcriptional regulator YiaG